MSTYVYEIDFAKQSFIPGIPAVDFVQGLIITDCNNCIISAGDVLDWSLVLSAGADVSVLTNHNSIFYPPIPGDLVATPLGLYYNFQDFTGPSGFSTTYTVNVNNGPQLVFDLNYLAWTAGSTYVNMYSTPHGPPSDLIASAVPEPGTWALLLFGFAFVALKKFALPLKKA